MQCQNDEECSAGMYSEESCEVEIPTVKYIAGVGFVVNPVYGLVVADFCVCDLVVYGDLSDDINLCVYFDARLCTAKKSPLENGYAEIDVTRSWSSAPLISVQDACDRAAMTETKTGLKFFTPISTKVYEIVLTVRDKYKEQVAKRIRLDDSFHNWNYLILPT